MNHSNEQLAVVTGASSGIGRALALELSARGFRVLALARSIEKLKALRAEAGEQIVAVAADLASEESLKDFSDWALDEFGVPTTLINNAGAGVLGPFVESQPRSWRDQIDVNLHGALQLTHAFLPGMIERRYGVVVNVGSSAASGWPFLSVYAASKAALDAASRAIDAEVASHGVRVLAVEIGPTAGTAFGSEFSKPVVAAAAKRWRELGIPFDKPESIGDACRRILTAMDDALATGSPS